jgi:hypothetical protein
MMTMIISLFKLINWMGNGMLEHVVFHWLRWGHIKECIEEDL